MAINAFPIQTVPPAANLIANIPAGSVTATDVQNAINQLASLIPAVGSGTDPLALVNGLTVITDNPNDGGGNANDRRGITFQVNTDCANVNPDFTNVGVLVNQLIAVNGQATYGTNTQVKETFYCVNNSFYAAGSGQKFVTNDTVQSYAMSDTAIGQQLVQYAGGPVNGDEGQGFRLVSRLIQQQNLSVYHIQSIPTPATINTTTTQAITRNQAAQTVTVVSTIGAAVGDWVVIDQELPTAGQNKEAVKIQAISPTSITGIFRCNHLIGATIKPALRLVLDGTFQLGQDRVLVNLSSDAHAQTYSTGTVSSIAGGGFTGTGTNWTVGMVGGNALNIGAITLAADDYTSTPFDAGANRLRSWYQINAITSPTLLGAFRTSVAGDGSYHGRGPIVGSGNPASTYTIRPCAQILRLVTVPGTAASLTGEVICENSTSTWAVGDTVEEVICPYPDVTGFQYVVSNWTNGATLRSFWQIRNMGARRFDSCLFVDNWAQTDVINGGDGVNWNTIIDLQASCNQAIAISPYRPTVAAIQLGGAFSGGGATDKGGRILWGVDSPNPIYIGVNTPVGGLELNTQNGGPGIGYGRLSFGFASTALSPVISELNDCKMQWGGGFWMPVILGHRGSIYIDTDTTSTTSFERAFFRWNNNAGVTDFRLEIGTAAGSGGGTVRDWILMKGTSPFFTTLTYPVSQLPAPGVKGRRLFVTDANATLTAGIGAVVAGGGANNVPVHDDGTNWRIG